MYMRRGFRAQNNPSSRPPVGFARWGPAASTIALLLLSMTDTIRDHELRKVLQEIARLHTENDTKTPKKERVTH